MALSGPQYQQLQNALLATFEDEESLQQFVQIRLGESLHVIVGTGALSNVVFRLIGWMQAHGQLDDLLTGALADRPRSNEIRAFVATYFPVLLSPTAPAPTSASPDHARTLLETAMSRPLSITDRIKRDALQKRLDLLGRQYAATLNSLRLEGEPGRMELLKEQLQAREAEIHEVEAELATLGGSSESIVAFVAPSPPAAALATALPQNAALSGRDQVFISYSHVDTRWLNQLLEQLAPLEQQGKVNRWSDKEIETGAEWEKEIQAALAKAKVAVLLVSPSFLASPFIAKKELPPLFAAAEQEGVTIFWISVRDSNYKETPIAKYQAANDPAHPLNTLTAARRDQEWVRISRKLLAAFN